MGMHYFNRHARMTERFPDYVDINPRRGVFENVRRIVNDCADLDRIDELTLSQRMRS